MFATPVSTGDTILLFCVLVTGGLRSGRAKYKFLKCGLCYVVHNLKALALLKRMPQTGFKKVGSAMK